MSFLSSPCLSTRVRAFNAFQEALKSSYDNWKIWENYLLVGYFAVRQSVFVLHMTVQVSLDIGELEEVIRAYHRLLDIKSKHLDTEVREKQLSS